MNSFNPRTPSVAALFSLSRNHCPKGQARLPLIVSSLLQPGVMHSKVILRRRRIEGRVQNGLLIEKPPGRLNRVVRESSIPAVRLRAYDGCEKGYAWQKNE